MSDTATAGPRLEPVAAGVTRITLPLPWALDHVHCYAVEEEDGLTVIDAGLGGAGSRELWRTALARLGGAPVRRLIVTHYHPDHVGGGAALVALTGAAEVVQGRIDHRLSELAWRPGGPGDLADYLREHGMPAGDAAASERAEGRLGVDPAAPTALVDEGDRLELGGRTHTVRVLPGHADGHIVLDGGAGAQVFGGDVLLAEITPNVGRWPDTLPDPLGRYLESLTRLEHLRPALVLPGHGPPIADVAGRVAEIRAHHAERLDAHEHALHRGAASAHAAAQIVWANDGLGFHEQRFALVEAISHLERLEREGRAIREPGGRWRPA
jgi:glyoxylase-like metal-dependent hydrolase (beta-lactamase superfamily II)